MSGSILTILALSNGEICARFNCANFCLSSVRGFTCVQFFSLCENGIPFYCRSSDRPAEREAAHLEINFYV